MPGKRQPSEDEDNESDPVVAEYPIYLTPNDPSTTCHLFQYLDRSSTAPYNNRTQHKPAQVRLKPSTGIVEVDVPISFDYARYDEEKGDMFGLAMKKSKVMKGGGSYGLSGGFTNDVAHNGVAKNEGRSGGRVRIGGEDGDSEMDTDESLGVQTMGGRILPGRTTDPVDVIGTFRDDELHLTMLNGSVQLRAQLHHLDAAQEISRSGRSQPKSDEGLLKTEARAVEMRVKSTDGDEMNMKKKAELLQAIQTERWKRYGYRDAYDEDSRSAATQHLVHPDINTTDHLMPVVKNEDYADGMSAPRYDPANPNKKKSMMRVWCREMDPEPGETIADETNDDVVEIVEEKKTSDTQGPQKDAGKGKGQTKRNPKPRKPGNTKTGTTDAKEVEVKDLDPVIEGPS